MRLIKLSKEEFPSLDEVRDFFNHDIRGMTPSGKFRVPSGWIAQDALEAGEALIFAYQSRAVFTARAGSELRPNDDEWHERYPSYFLVDLESLREVDANVRDI